MNENEKIITKFYDALAAGNTSKMLECYHPTVKFRDPIFGSLNANEVSKMWEMLIIRSSGNLKIKLSDVKSNEYNGTALWVASYNFSKNKRPVVNRISAQFYFQDGLIIRHTDDFDIWKWSKQALGLTGYLFGWTGFMQNKIHTNAILSLRKYQKTNS
jgi:hypothetical protein